MMKSAINRNHAPTVKPLQFDGFPEYRTEKINNQFPCYILENFNSEVVRLDISIPKGFWIQQKQLQASSMARMLTEGTSKYNSFQIAETIDFSGAYVDITASSHNTVVSIYAVKHILVTLLPLIKSILTEPTFPVNELKTIMSNNKQEFIIGNKKVMGKARRLFPSMLYGENHPYGHILQESDFDNISPDNLKDFFATLPFQESKLYIGGNIDTDVMSSLSDLLSAFSNNETKITEKEFIIDPSAEKEKLIVVPEAVQSAIIMGLPVVGRKHPDFPLLMLTNTILGGYFGSRLMKTIREEKGFTYGISSGMAIRQKATHLSIQTEVMTEVTQQALDEIFKEISRLSTRKVAMEELDTARNYLFGNLLRSMDGPFSIIERLETIHSDGLNPETYYRNYWDITSKATPEDIRQTAEKYLNPENMRVLIAGNKK